MIEDKARPPKPMARDWAVFRYGLISEALRPLEGQTVSEVLQRAAARQHQLPDGTLRRYSVAALRLWLDAYRREGLDALLPRARSDKGSFRKIDETIAEIIAQYRVQQRRLSVTLFWQVLHQDQVLPAGVTVCQATLRRFLKSRGLDRPARDPERARAKYEMPHPNDLWVGDFMHGPQVKTGDGKRKAILCAILDDHSRVAVAGRWALSEDTADLPHALRDAIATYGVPKRFYCDNGSAFSSQHLAEAAARIGVTLLHSEPYDAPARGKVERFFRTVRDRFLPLLVDADLATLAALQLRFDTWLRDDYLLKRHGGLGMKPLDRYLAGAQETLIARLSVEELDQAFMGRIVRVVRNDSTIRVDGRFYEVPPDFIGARVDVRYPVGRPDTLILYRDDKPLGPIHPVDPAANARFHAPRVALSYAAVIQRRQENTP